MAAFGYTPAPAHRSDTDPEDEVTQEVVAKLNKHGISTLCFDKEGALGVRELARDVADSVCVLEADESDALVRTLMLVEISLVVNIAGGRLVLVEEEHVLDDGRRRRFPQRKPHGKIRRGEAPLDAAWRALRERLGLSSAAAATLRATAQDEPGVRSAVSMAESETVEACSNSFPGLRTSYVVYKVEFQVPPLLQNESSESRSSKDVSEEGMNALMAELGLPSARSFMTVEGQLGPGNGGRVHLWRWTMAEDRIEGSEFAFGTSSFAESELGDDAQNASEEEDESDEDAIGIEEAYKDLSATLRCLRGQKALLHERGTHQETRLDTAEDRIKKVMCRLSNIEGLVKVNALQLFGEKGNEKKRMSRSLRHFISSNFTDGANKQDDVSSTMSPSAMSSVARGPASDAEEEAVSVEGGSERLQGKLPRIKVSDSEPHSLSGSPHPSPSMEVKDFISEVEDIRNAGDGHGWILDAIGLHERTGRRALLVLAEVAVVPHVRDLGTSEKTMREFMTQVHKTYEEWQNQFHNEAHATAVCHATHWLATHSKAWEAMSPQMRIATDIAALAHDVGHFGRNNAFCTSAGHDLALIYNDRSILENMHSATCFELMKELGCDILSACSRDTRRQFREQVVSLILATDMASHFDFLGKFRVRVANEEFSLQDNADDRRLVMHCVLKAADLGHAALPWEMHERWAFRLLNEFYEQGDEERSMGIPVSPLCERSGNVGDFRESQKGFLQFVIMPLFKELVSEHGDKKVTVTSAEVRETCLARVESNAEKWVSGEPNPELVKLIKAPAGPVKSTVSTSSSPFLLSPRRKIKGKKDLLFQRSDGSGGSSFLSKN
eukprot:TRINITY_DN8917_c0_g1_i1.p1 TRINITY_DN8917_c0_g1~~TRINITY_DN8917_c0_g1_i1.p1  ORF type:complete len:838 (+),score=154.01 TRINITY_DN8917_c0_g1_i1:125-2638(+)